MFRTAPAALSAVALLALAACASNPAADASAEAQEMAADCNAEAAQSLVGQPAGEDVVERARAQTGTETIRTIKPGQPITMDHRLDRLNLETDAEGVITAVRCG